MKSMANTLFENGPPIADPRPSSTALWQRYRAAGPGDSSEEELVKQYLSLVKTVAGRLAITLPAHVSGEDLYSAGLVGLLSAVRQFNPNIGTAFEPYARVRIRGAILDELRRMDWVPRSIHAKARKIQQAMRAVEKTTGTLPNDEEVAAALQISVPEYEQWVEEVRPATFICLDAAAMLDGEQEMTEHEMMPDDAQPAPFDEVSRAELAQLVLERIKQLPETQRKILALYYYEGLRLREIAAAFGFCESHICQMHAKAILTIRAYLETYEERGSGVEGNVRLGAQNPSGSPRS